VGNTTFSRQVMPTRGFLSQSELPVTFGLGKADRVNDITVVWPDGSTQKVTAKLNTLTIVEQPR
jgi:enediyne biosynthesis protein E4